MPMSPAMLAALQAHNPVLIHLLRIELPGHTIRLVDGSVEVAWGAEAFRGEDPEFGAIAGFGDFQESEGTEAPRQTVQLLTNNNAALSRLTEAGAQGSPVSIYAAAYSRQTGQIIGAPDPRFVGELDDATWSVSKNSTLLELELATVWERLFDDNEGHRWNHTFWTYLFGANARAFEGMPNVGEQMYWGYHGPSKGSGGSSYGGGGSTGGGGGLGGGEVQREVY